MGSDDETSDVTHYSPAPLARTVTPALSVDDRRGSEYGNVFRNGAENYGVLPSVLPPAIDPNNPSYNNLPINAGVPAAAAAAAPRASAPQTTTRATLMKVIYDKILAPSPGVLRSHGYDVVKPRSAPGAGGTYDVVHMPDNSSNDNTRASMSITVHDDAPMEVLDDVTLDSSGSGASDSSAERKRNNGGGARIAGAGRNQYEAIASRLTLSTMPSIPALPPTMRPPVVPSAAKK